MINYKVSKDLSSNEFNQSDFGKIYYNIPSERYEPKSTKELALLLKELNGQDKRVTIRNTGHSVNGQTLTDSVQVSVANIRNLRFNEEKLEVTAGAGITWDEIFTIINLPKYSVPVFTNNPGQRIRVGGTASVGGFGFLGTKHGGCWEHITKIKLVTMTGEIIHCSREKNFEIMKYALGGFGRIGVITEVTLKVVKTLPNFLNYTLVYHDFDSYFRDYKKALDLNLFDGVIGEHVINFDFGVGFSPYLLILLKEYCGGEDAKSTEKIIKENLGPDLNLYLSSKAYSKVPDFDIGFSGQFLSRKNITYFYPHPKEENQMKEYHPWSDYFIPESRYKEFFTKAVEVLKKYNLVNYLPKESMIVSNIDMLLLPTYSYNRAETTGNFEYPLTMPFDGKERLYGIPILPTVPYEMLDDAMKMIKELTDLTYKYGGIRYLYGIHDLTKDQIYKHFGKETIKKWQEHKDKLDPKHLLNIGVIEHLDI